MWYLVPVILCAAAAICPAADPAPVALFFGDSICEGSNIPGGGKRTDAWPAVWAAGNGGSFALANASRGGRPTAALDEFAKVLAANPKAALLVLALGTNDSRDLAPDMADKAVANLRRMIADARAAGIGRIIVVGPYNINLDGLKQTHAIGPQREANLRRLNQAYEAMAMAEKTEFLSMFGVIPGASLTADGVHPDKAGQAAIARRFADYLAKPAPK